MSSVRSAETFAAMDTDVPPQQHKPKQGPQQQQTVEQPPSQSLGQPGFPTPFGNNSLQVRSFRVVAADFHADAVRQIDAAMWHNGSSQGHPLLCGRCSHSWPFCSW